MSPVLAQIFTEPFTVFSAKRFPGVPGIILKRTIIIRPILICLSDTTALSIAFGNQGQKLPLVRKSGWPARRFLIVFVFSAIDMDPINVVAEATLNQTMTLNEHRKSSLGSPGSVTGIIYS